MAEAMELTGLPTKKAAVEEALRRLVRQARQRRAIQEMAGIAVRKPVGLIIATFCIEREYVLLHDDRGFAPFAKHLGLQTL